MLFGLETLSIVCNYLLSQVHRPLFHHHSPLLLLPWLLRSGSFLPGAHRHSGGETTHSRRTWHLVVCGLNSSHHRWTDAQRWEQLVHDLLKRGHNLLKQNAHVDLNQRGYGVRNPSSTLLKTYWSSKETALMYLFALMTKGSFEWSEQKMLSITAMKVASLKGSSIFLATKDEGRRLACWISLLSGLASVLKV